MGKIVYKVDVLEALKAVGYSTYRIRKEKIFGEKQVQAFRNGDAVLGEESLCKLCEMLDCQPGDLLEFIKDK